MTQTKDIRILLVDDHMVVRKGLYHVLDSITDMNIVGEAESGEEALFLCQKLKPDIVVMDIKMDGMGGIETTRLIAKHHPLTRIIGLSTFAHQEVVTEMLDAGATGYLLKDVSASDLANAIRRVHLGETLCFPDLTVDPDESAQPSNPNAPAEPPVKMGDQQSKVLALMTKGFTNPEIAAHLDISQPTARYHVSAILQKLDVSNRSEAVAMAIRLNLVTGQNY